MKFSIVIPAYNEEASLPDTLESIARQKTDYAFDVIVVDNNSTDDTTRVAKSYSDRINIRVVRESIKGRGVARRTGFSLAQGDIIISSDADTILPENFISTIGNYFSKPGSNVAVTALCRFPSKKLSIRIFNALLPIGFRLFKLVYGHYWLNGYAFAIKRDIYFASGGFNIDIDAQEDVELSTRVSRLGKIDNLPELKIISSDRRFKSGLLLNLLPYVQTFYQMKRNNIKATKLDDKR